jgi:hypothetical protein
MDTENKTRAHALFSIGADLNLSAFCLQKVGDPLAAGPDHRQHTIRTSQ